MPWSSQSGRLGCVLFNAITMMYVDINVQYTGMIFQQFQDSEHDIINITEARRPIPLCMMQPARPTTHGLARKYQLDPLDSNIGISMIQFLSRSN